MDRHELFDSFWSHFGTEEATKFILELHRSSTAKKRLFFWQERMLNEFCAKAGIEPLTYAEAITTFSRCHLHGADLLQDSVAIKYGTRMPVEPELIIHADRTYPFANLSAYGPCWVESETHRKVIFCPACRSAYFIEQATKRNSQSLD